jgi:hypothetical protein
MFKTNKDTEQNGIFLEYGKTADGRPIRFKIARAGGNNTKFAKLLDRKTKPYRRQLQNETMDPKVAEQIFMEVYSESVVLGWENVEDENGSPLNYSPEACLKLFKDLPDLFNDIRDQSTKISSYQLEVRESEAKN